MKYSDSQQEQTLKKLIAFTFFLFIFLSFTRPLQDPDTPWHLKTGEYILSHNTIPTSDPFSYADDSLPFIGQFILSQYWLAQSFLFLIYKSFGVIGLVLMGATILTLLAAVIQYLLRDKGFYLSFLITGLFVFFIREFSAIRPQLFTFLFSGIVICLFEKYKKERNLAFLFPLIFLMPLWSNLHGGFIYGVILIVIYILSEGLQFYVKKTEAVTASQKMTHKQMYYLLTVCCLAILCSMANPNSCKAFSYAFTTHSQDLFSKISEYRSPFEVAKKGASALIFGYWVYIIASAIMLAVFVKRRDITPLILLSFSIVPALVSIRYFPLFMIVSTSMFRYVPVKFRPEINLKIRYGLHIALFIIFLSLILIFNPLKHRNIYQFNDSTFYAVKASNFLIKNNISGNIFASYNKSAYLLFRLFPESRLYSDSRFLSEKRMRIADNIEGDNIPLTEVLESISRLIPENIGTIQIAGLKATPSKAGGINALRPPDDLAKSAIWKESLDNIKADIIVHEALDVYSGDICPLIFNLVRDNSWRLIYTDKNVLIFLRDIQKYKDIILKYDKPKSLIYDEILYESMKGLENNLPSYYASAALALLLKGSADNITYVMVERALALSPNSPLANYCNTLYVLINHSKNQGKHQ